MSFISLAFHRIYTSSEILTLTKVQESEQVDSVLFLVLPPSSKKWHQQVYANRYPISSAHNLVFERWHSLNLGKK